MNKQIAIHGLGYVGLTAAVYWAKAGWRVIGYDPDLGTITALRAGTPRAGEFLSYLNEDVARLVWDGMICPTHAFVDTLDSMVHIIAVPTEQDGVPHDKIVRALISQLLTETVEGAMILVESTLAPGTIDLALNYADDVVAAVRPRSLAVCPRRDWFADREKNLETLPRVVGGISEDDTARACELLRTVSKTVLPTDYRTAELTKALENSLLHVPIMLATELAMNLPKLDVAEALRLACTHWRLMDLYLGMGTGGRCVPLGTQYLLKAAGGGGVLESAVTADRHIRIACAEAVQARGAKTALVLGVAYRPHFRDAGLSPGLAVAQYLSRTYAIDVTVADPMWTPDELRDLTGFPVLVEGHMDPKSEGLIGLEFDAVLLATPHIDYHRLPEFVHWRAGQFVLDGSGAWAKYKELFERAGVEYRQVGMAGWRGGR